MTMNKNTDDSLSLPNIRSARRRFSLRRFFCRRPSTRFALSLVGGSISERNKNEDGSLQSMTGVSVNTAPVLGHQSSKSADTKSSNDSNYCPSGAQGAGGTSTNGVDGSGVECILCYNPQPREDFPNVGTCGHHFCFTCLRRYLEIEISESRVFLTCPQCPAELLPSVVYDLVEDPKLIERYENYLLRRFLVHCNDTRWCPAPDCGYAVIATDCDFCPKIKCQRPNCNTSFCYHCKNTWHPNQTCAMARIERQEIEVDANDASLTELKECPNCKQCIAKLDDGTCNHMSCPVCGMQFCWLCLKEITDLHYLSPSGCTFWGSRPWSKKKKWISQIATFVGGPVGIVLASTIAIPAVIIGTPIYVGRKIYDLKFKSKTKRKVATATGVVSSMVVSPVIAALAVTVGAPLMLGYLYIVIPIGLVRGYGHAKSSSSNKKKVVDVNEVSLFADSSSSLKIKRTNESGDTRRCSSVDSVGPLDTASTKALAGSIYTRDMDSIKYDTISVISQNAEKIRSPLK